MPRQYNIRQLQKILSTVYDGYTIWPVILYKNKGRRVYELRDKNNQVVIPMCYLDQLGEMLEKEGDLMIYTVDDYYEYLDCIIKEAERLKSHSFCPNAKMKKPCEVLAKICNRLEKLEVSLNR